MVDAEDESINKREVTPALMELICGGDGNNNNHKYEYKDTISIRNCANGGGEADLARRGQGNFPKRYDFKGRF